MPSKDNTDENKTASTSKHRHPVQSKSLWMLRRNITNQYKGTKFIWGSIAPWFSAPAQRDFSTWDKIQCHLGPCSTNLWCMVWSIKNSCSVGIPRKCSVFCAIKGHTHSRSVSKISSSPPDESCHKRKMFISEGKSVILFPLESFLCPVKLRL